MRRFVLVLVYVLYFKLEFELSIIKEKYEKLIFFVVIVQIFEYFYSFLYCMGCWFFIYILVR